MSQFDKFSFASFIKKMLVACFSVLASVPTFAFVEMENRKATAVEDGLLTPFWAQEYIGADLVKKEMQVLSNLPSVPFAIYDSGFEKNHVRLNQDVLVDRAMNGSRIVKGHHGTSVANIINGSGMMSVSEVVQYVQLRKVSPAIFYSGAVSDMLQLPIKPMIISNSMGWTAPDVKDLAEKVDQMGIIWVMASGNDHPTPIAEHERTAPVISVGSYSPRGLQTRSSQESDQLDVLAPGDEYQASIDGNGEPVLFGGTSGATPLVSGSIANIKSLIPSLTRTQVEKLIKRTAFHSLHQRYSTTNKTGLFNAYKMFRVALRINQACGQQEVCVATEIENERNYIFSSPALKENIQKICQSSEVLSAADMSSLRRNLFLSENPASFASLLSCAYRNENFSINADYYENLALIYRSPSRLQAKIRQQAVQAVEKGYGESAALRDAELLDESYHKALQNIQSETQGIGSYRAKELLDIFDRTSKIELKD